MESKEELIKVLESYKNYNRVSQLMIAKIHELESNIYSAQSGFVEREIGMRVDGGKHLKREERIASLIDLKDQYAKHYSKCEQMCYFILNLIQNLYTNNINVKNNSITFDEQLKLQRFELVLTAYYVNLLKISEIAIEEDYSIRHVVRLLNSAKEELFKITKDLQIDFD